MSRKTIGFDRDLDLRWLDAVAGRVAAGELGEDLRAYVWRMLEGEVAGDAPRSGRGKTCTVLLHIWSRVPEEVVPLRNRALAVVTSGTPSDRAAAHWAMTMATYPFFADVVTITGRLLTLQERASLDQVTRRLVERWGERSGMIRAVRRVIRSIVRWGLLGDTERPGVYVRPANRIRVDGSIAAVLLEAAIRSGELREYSPEALVRHPGLFPFEAHLNARELAAAGFGVHGGLGGDTVSLATSRSRR